MKPKPFVVSRAEDREVSLRWNAAAVYRRGEEHIAPKGDSLMQAEAKSRQLLSRDTV